MVVKTGRARLELLTSAELCDRLGVADHILYGLLRRRAIAPPAKDGSGRLLWTLDDLERVRAALVTRESRRGSVLAPAVA